VFTGHELDIDGSEDLSRGLADPFVGDCELRLQEEVEHRLPVLENLAHAEPERDILVM
jgi:hypothetical protein